MVLAAVDWKNFHTHHGASFEAGLVNDYGDFQAEAEALWQTSGVVSLEDSGALVVRGPDALDFLNSMASNHIRALPVLGATESPALTQPNLFCNRHGKVLHEVQVLRTHEQQFLLLTRADGAATADGLAAVAAHLAAFQVRERVEIGQAPLTLLTISGQQSSQTLESLGLSVTKGRGTFKGASLLLAKDALWQPPLPARYFVLLPDTQVLDWLHHLEQQAPTVRLAGRAAWEEVRIAAARPLYGVDYDSQTLPAAAGLNTHISSSKGCYLGQEVHARLRHRGKMHQQLAAFWLPSASSHPLPAAGASLYSAEKAAARITSMGKLSLDNRLHGIAWVSLTHTQPRMTLSPQGEPVAALRLL